MKENPIQKRILLACSRGASRLFRMNVGMGWIGQSKRFGRVANIYAQPGDVLIRNARPFHAGIEGMSDLIGWRTIEITPDMVGKKVAVYAAIEVKQKTGRIRPEQKAFIDNVKKHGGIAGVARSVEEAESLLTVPHTLK